MNHHHRPTYVGRLFGLAWVAGAWLVLLAASTLVHAQLTPGMKINNFSASEPFPSPNYKQMRYVVTGAEGRTQTNKTILLTKLKLQTFKVNGELEMTVEAPECIFNREARTAESAGKLTLQSGDGKLRVEGNGFGCRLDEKTLIISNDVKAVIVRPNTNANAAPLVITSRWLEFDADKRLAIFHDDVRGDDPDFAFTCGTLAVSGSTTNESSFDLIDARDALVVTGKAAGQRASADRGIYRAAEGSVELIGNATWDVEGKSGRAHRVLGFRNDRSVQAEGNVAMRLPRGSLGAATGLLSASNTPAQNAAMVDVFADKFHWRSNAITGDGNVRVVDATNRVSFSCDALEARQAANALDDETAVATGNVKVERDGANIVANRADYSKRAEAVVFTGNPHWRQEQMEGSAERVTFKTKAASEEIEADKNVAVKITVPAKGGGSPLTFFSPGLTNRTTQGLTNQTIEITSRLLNVKQGRALFTGDIGAYQSPRTGSEDRLHCDKLEVLFASSGGKLNAIAARDNVTYEQGTAGVTNGPALYRKMTCQSLTAKADATSSEPTELVAAGGVRIEQPGSEARGDKMIYNHITRILTLTGQPRIETPEAIFNSQKELVWDNARQTVVSSDYNIVVKPEVLKSAAESQKLPRP